MRRPLIAASFFVLATVIAASAREATPSVPDLSSFALMRTGDRAPAAVTVDQAADALKNFDVIFFGEWHDHSGNHNAEMALFRALQTRAPKLALSMEMFERDVQQVMDDYLAGKIGEEALRDKGHAWPNYAESYRPLVEYAKEKNLPVIAANAPGSVVRCVGIEGPDYLARMPAEKRSWAAADLHLDEGPYKEKYLRFMEEDGAHGQDANRTPEEKKAAADRSFAAQVTRDDTMAESIALYLNKNPGAKVVHVTGDFHVAEKLGTVERLKLRAPNLKIALVVPVEASSTGAAYDADDAKGADYVFLLRAEPKEYASDAEKKEAEDRMQANFRRATAPSRCQS